MNDVIAISILRNHREQLSDALLNAEVEKTILQENLNSLIKENEDLKEKLKSKKNNRGT